MRRTLFQLNSNCAKWILLACISATAAVAHGQDAHCAWLNNATASGVLNGPVTLELETAPAPDQADRAICVFTNAKSAKDYSALRIVVQPLKDVDKAVASHESLCTSPAAAIKAIGNEAIGCAADVGYSRGEQVIGRVRDRLFIVTVSSTIAQDPAMTRQLLRDKAKMIAEQVAGALF